MNKPNPMTYKDWLKSNSEKWRECEGEGLVIDKISFRKRRQEELLLWNRWVACSQEYNL